MRWSEYKDDWMSYNGRWHIRLLAPSKYELRENSMPGYRYITWDNFPTLEEAKDFAFKKQVAQDLRDKYKRIQQIIDHQ